MANFTSSAATINGRLPAFYALPISQRLPTSTNPYPNPLPVLEILQTGTFSASANATGSITNVYDVITLTGVSATAGTLPAVGNTIVINAINFFVLFISGTSPTASLTLTSQTNFSNGEAVATLGTNTWTMGTNVGAFTTGQVQNLGVATQIGQTDPAGIGQSFIAIIFGAGNQAWDVGAIYQPTGSTNWIYPMGVVAGGPTYAIVTFPNDVAPTFQGPGPVVLTRISRLPVIGDTITLSDSANVFTWSTQTQGRDSQNQFWRVSA